jgi:3-deoxy-manno-octulosonate cytidylyltransferase (CMP-KDO synthetase)
MKDRDPSIGQVWCVIPARLNSERLPGKLLRADHGEPLLQTTILNAWRTGLFDAVIVLIDDAELLRFLNRRMPEQITTICRDGDFRNGTERVASLFAGRSAGREPQVVVALQADEPEVHGDDLKELISAAAAYPCCDMATLAGAIMPENRDRENVVKVNIGFDGFALDFRRTRTDRAQFHHVGVYAWRPAALRWYRSLAPSGNERDLSLEQMRVLDNGGSIRVVIGQAPFPGIDDEPSYLAFCERVAWRKQIKDPATWSRVGESKSNV